MLRFLSETNHAHIANLLAEYDAGGGGTHAMLFYCRGGSLQYYLGKLRKKEMAMAESLAAVCTAQMASALSFLHSMGIAHRDIKPANILYDGRRWRLCDFGFAVPCAEDERLTHQCGSLGYAAPELLFGDHYFGRAVDMWAFGCTVYEMRVGRMCFVADDLDSLKLRIKKGFKGGTEMHPWLPHMKLERTLIASLLVRDPAQRLTAEQVLASAWIEENAAPTARAAPIMDDDETTMAEAEAEAAPEPMREEEDACEDLGMDDLDIGQPQMVVSWWCDVAGPGCIRPVEGQYPDDEHRCWSYMGQYMVCEACYRRGEGVEHMEELQLVSGPPL